MSQAFSIPPPGVGIKLVKSSAVQLVMAVPPGGKRARSIGCFGVFWLGITAAVSGGFLFADDAPKNGGNGPPLLVLIPFFGRASIRMSREKVTGSIGFWFLRKKKTISIESISDFGHDNVVQSAIPAAASSTFNANPRPGFESEGSHDQIVRIQHASDDEQGCSIQRTGRRAGQIPAQSFGSQTAQ
jgi:hypothetical protein